MVQYAVLPTSSPGCETTLGTRVRFASYLLQSLENKFNKTDRLSPYSQNSSYYHWRKYKSLITLEPTSILLECVPVAPNSYRQRSLHLLDNLKIQFFTFIKKSNKYSKILVFKCSVNVLFSFIINYIFHFSIYTLSDLGDLSNLIGSLSRTIQQYSPPSEWIMCELGVFPVFFGERSFKSRQNPRADFF